MYRFPDVLSRLLSPWLTLRVGSDNEVFLTFDDGPDPVSTPAILQLLNQYQVKAAFFVTGTAATNFPYLVSQIQAMGHSVHTHGWSHIPVRKIPMKQWLSELKHSFTFSNRMYYRPPYGRITLRKLWAVKRLGISVILWNVDPQDYLTGEPEIRKLKRLSMKIKPGDIVLLHDKPGAMAKTLLYTEHIIKHIHTKGLVLSTFS